MQNSLIQSSKNKDQICISIVKEDILKIKHSDMIEKLNLHRDGPSMISLDTINNMKENPNKIEEMLLVHAKLSRKEKAKERMNKLEKLRLERLENLN